MLTKTDIISILDKFNNTDGKPVIVHTSLKAIGQIEGGAETLLDALIDRFTRNGGLLCIPTHTWNSDVMDMRKAESCIGVLPTIAAGHPKAVRTLHPTHSMAVFGNEQTVLNFVEDEQNVETPTSPKGCYGKIFEMDGYVLLIGVGQDKNTYLHCVEEMLEVPERLTKEKVKRTIIHKDGTAETRYLNWFYTEKIPDVSENFGKLEAAFDYHGCITYSVLGNAKMQFCSARKMKTVFETVYKNNNRQEFLADSSPLDKKLYTNGKFNV